MATTTVRTSKICDIHQHIVYGVDDGARDFEMSVRMLELAAGQGTTDIVCTSHVSRRTTEQRRDLYDRRFEKLSDYVANNGIAIRLHRGSEVFFCENCIDLINNGIANTLGDSHTVLIEFLPYEQLPTIKHALRELYNGGFVPVIAHVERYSEINSAEIIAELKIDYNAVIQMNASTVYRSRGLFGNRFIKRVIKSGLVDVIGSDAHDTGERKSLIGEAYAVLAKEYGEDRADLLCRKNALDLLASRSI